MVRIAVFELTMLASLSAELLMLARCAVGMVQCYGHRSEGQGGELVDEMNRTAVGRREESCVYIP
jgi:hypothetical protein